MIHMKSLLWSWSFNNNIEEIEQHLVRSIVSLQSAWVDAIMFENNDDMPCKEFISLAQSIHFAYLIWKIKDKIKIPFGFTILLNDWKTGIALCKVSWWTVLRLDSFVDTVKRVSDGIIISPNPEEIMKYKKALWADNVKIYTDVHVKHTEMVDQGKTLEESIEQAIKQWSDGIIITWSRTGVETDYDEVKRAKLAINKRVPLIIGSGINKKNIAKYKDYADICIVWTSIKEWDEISFTKTKELVDIKNTM